ncbi:MAG: helix-turn-helix domain-containing protein [Asgard group archaeon]|nr:helix-turn-helix domain-containing protein [Asgard group archaeon]
MSVKEVKSSLLEQIGFNDEEQEVYLTILGIGAASLGEVYLQTGIPFEDLQPIVQELTNRGYLKRIEGKINRYIAVEPFLKGFLFVEKEFQNDIIGIENSLINVFDSSYDELVSKVDEFKEAVKPIFLKISEELRNANEQLKMDLTDAIYRHSDKISRIGEDFDATLSEGFKEIYLTINNELSNLEGEIGDILRAESDEAQERIRKFELLTTKVVEDMMDPLNSAIEEYEKTVPKEVKSLLNDNKKEISSVQKEIQKVSKNHLNEFGNTTKDFEKEFHQILDDAIKGYQEILKNYQKTVHQLFSDQKKKVEPIVQNLIKDIGENIEELSVESQNLKENVKDLSKTGFLRRPNQELVDETLKRLNKINSISQTVKEDYDDILNAYQKDLIEALSELIDVSEKHFEKEQKERIKQIENLKKESEQKWSDISKNFKKELMDSVKDVFKEAQPKIEMTTENALQAVLSHLEDLKKNYTKILAPIKNEIYSDAETMLDNLYLDSSKRLRLYSDKNEQLMKTIQSIGDDTKFKFIQNVKELLNKPKTIASDMVSEYTTTLDSYLTHLDRDHESTMDIISQACEKFLTTIKDSFDSSNNEISNRLAALLYKVNETKTYLQEITDAVDNITPIPRPHSLIIYGDDNSMSAIKDMLIRTKSTCTLVVPTINNELAEFIQNQISRRVRVRILADLKPFEDEALIAAFKEQGNISLWQYTMRDFFAVTRDGAEVLLAPVSRDGELTSFITEQDALVRAVQQIINASFMARSKEL